MPTPPRDPALAEFLEDFDDGLLTIDGCDAALLGVALRCACPPVAVYDYRALVACFVGQGMTEEEAEEHISFNVTGAWCGEQTPFVLRRPATSPSSAVSHD